MGSVSLFNNALSERQCGQGREYQVWLMKISLTLAAVTPADAFIIFSVCLLHPQPRMNDLTYRPTAAGWVIPRPLKPCNPALRTDRWCLESIESGLETHWCDLGGLVCCGEMICHGSIRDDKRYVVMNRISRCTDQAGQWIVDSRYCTSSSRAPELHCSAHARIQGLWSNVAR